MSSKSNRGPVKKISDREEKKKRVIRKTQPRSTETKSNSKPERKKSFEKSNKRHYETSDAEESDEETYDYDNGSSDALIKMLSEKLKFHVFNPDSNKMELQKNIIILPPDHRLTSEILTEYEYTEVTSHRAKQIENGSPVFVDYGDETDPVKMAELEIKMRKCPLSIRRDHNNTIAEIWEVNEMEVP